MGHEKRGEENNKEVMMKHDQDQKKKRHCLREMKHKGCTVRSNSDGTSLGQWTVLIAGCVDDKLC